MILINGHRKVSFFQLICIESNLYTLFQSYPFAYALMTRKTKELYLAVLRLIARTYEARYSDAPIAVVQLISDYELALMETVPEVFQRVQARGCWFHYGQAIIKQAAELGLNRGCREGCVVAHIMQQMIGLGLLPEDRIYAGFPVSKFFNLKISKGILNNLPLFRYPGMP